MTHRPLETVAGSAGKPPVEVSVVIPCLNEARSIATCIDKAMSAFRDAGIQGEVVVADNGSTDGSQDLAALHGARVVSISAKGYGNALRGGIERALGEFIIMGDADDSYDFGEVPRFVEKWREGFEVVMGNRFLGEIKPGAMPVHHRYIGNPVLSGILNLLFRSGIGDAHCGMRGFTAAAFRRLDIRTTGMEFASEFVIKAAKLRLRMTEIPITLWPDKRGRPPHLRSVPDGWRHLRFMLLYAPNWLFVGPGVGLSAIGLTLVLWLLPGPRHIGDVELDIHTMFFGMLFTLLGAQVLTIGIFAKVFCYSERFIHTERTLEGLFRTVRLETGLVTGTALALIGFAGNCAVLAEWAGSGFGAFHEMRRVIFWSMWLFLGAQTLFSSFFLSMLGISRDTFIGDYDTRPEEDASRSSAR